MDQQPAPGRRAGQRRFGAVPGAIAALCTLVLTVAAHATEVPWYRIESPELVVYSNTSRERAETLTRELLRFRAAVGVLTNTDYTAVDAPKPRVYLFRSDEQFGRTIKMRGLLGIHVTQLDGPLLIASVEDHGKPYVPNGLQVLRHEFVHALLHAYNPLRYPRWYDEGIAEYLATLEFDEQGAAIVGMPNIPMMRLIHRERWTDLEVIITANYRYLGWGRHFQYGVGWLLVHYMHASPERLERLRDFLRRINEDASDVETAWEETIGTSFWDFERELHHYFERHELPIFRLDPAALTTSTGQLAVTALNTDEAATIRTELRYARRSQDAKYRGALEKHFAHGGRQADMASYIVENAIFEEDLPGAREWHAELAKLVGDNDVRVPTLGAEIELTAALSAESADAARAYLMSARRLAAEAVRLDDTYVPARRAYARTLLESGEDPETALDHVEVAMRLLPDYFGLRVDLIDALIAAERFDEAAAELELLRGWSTGTRYDATIRQIEKRLKKARVSAGDP
jgi:hypothetical protein